LTKPSSLAQAAVIEEVESIFADQWKVRDGQKVPETEDIQLGNHAVLLNGTVLYADLAESTELVYLLNPGR